jgi:hypothetical protein
MARPIALSIRSLQFGGELARLIDEACRLPLNLKVVRVGAIESRATPENYAQMFPVVIVRPVGAEYVPSVANKFNVVDRYRVLYAVPVPPEEDVLPFAVEGLKQVGDALAADGALAEIANSIEHDQVTASLIEGTEYDPEEDTLLEQDVPVKVVALRWLVQWATC